jgi:hypothetical protein
MATHVFILATLVAASLTACAEAEEPELIVDPAAPARLGQASELWNTTRAMDREGQERARELVLQVYGVPEARVPEIQWVNGVECPGDGRLETIPFRGRCYVGLTFHEPMAHGVVFDGVFVVWPVGEPAISGTAFAHELAHCASLTLGLGMDTDHTGWIWDSVREANAALADDGL